MTEPSAELVERHNEKTSRFVALMGTHDRRLFGYILSLVPNYANAEDLAQQVRLRLWQQFDEYDVDKDFGAWSRTIARYFIMAHYKTVATQRARFSDQTVEKIAAEAEARIDQHDDRRWAMQECLGKLDEAKRRLLIHYYSTGDTMREIAAQLGRSFDSVRHSVLRTRLALADCMQRVLQREGVQ